jgi:HEAT repeat protein
VARHPSDAVLELLEAAVRSEQSEAVRRTAARSLVGYPSPRARQAVRTLIEDNSANDNLRREVLSRFDAERGTPDDVTWLRAAYPKVTSTPVRSAIVDAISRIGGADGRRWLMDLANNDAEPASVRSAAFRSVSRTMTVAELSRAYDAAGSRPMRESIVSALNSRKEPEALDKLIDIVKQSSDPTLRRTVIQMLAGKNDPKATQALLELIDR